MIDVYRTSPEIAAAAPELAVLGVGAIEQHGAHLPIGTDWLWISELSRRVAARLGALWLPAIPVSMSECHGPTAGTISLKPETLVLVIRDLALSLRASDIHKIALLNGHGGNFMLEPTIQELNLCYPDLTIIMPGRLPPPEPPIFETVGDIHAGEAETSLMLHLFPALVADQRVDSLPDVGQEFLDYAVMPALSAAGVWGRPTLATTAKGERAVAWQVEMTARVITDMFAAVTRLTQSPSDGTGP